MLFLLIVEASSMFAALSQTFVEWGNGPVQWIMTSEEHKSWKSITTDADAQAFIDLFWARRDPTPGTFENEFQAEFNDRVKNADAQFSDPTIKRGSMSDRGRALIVLGWPTNLQQILAQRQASDVPSAGGDSVLQASSMMGAKSTWIYERALAEKFGMPKIEIVFVQDTISGRVARDPQRPDMMAALPVAIEKAIVNRDLKVAPSWPKALPAIAVVQPSGTKTVPVRVGVPGAHALLLLKDAMALPNPQESKDPFAGAASTDSFAGSADLAYVFEYCGAAENLKTTIAIRGTGTSKVSMVAPTEEFPVEAIKTVPGCGLVRASIPLGDLNMAKGTYTFSVKVEDGQQAWNLAQDFKVE